MDEDKCSVLGVSLSMSLLDQCLLYNNPDYHPFTTAVMTTMKALEEPKIASSSGNISLSSNGGHNVPSAREAVGETQRQIDSSWLTSIDLDFSKPLPNGHHLCQPVTPLFPSTNRRTKHSKLTDSRPTKTDHLVRSAQRRKKQSLIRASPAAPRPQDNPSCTQPTTNKLDLLSLPGEIRNMLFSHLFEDARIYISHFPYCQHAFGVHLSIRATCRKIYAETDHILFERLKVYVIRDSRTLEGVLPIDKRIPTPLLTKLQSLIVLSSPWNPLTPSYLSFTTMPALRHLKIVETHADVVASVKYFDSRIQEYWDALGRADHGNRLGNPRVWLKKHLRNQQQLISLEFEKEVWMQSSGSRASHMGSLSKRHFLTVILTQVEQPIKTTRKVELTLEEFEQRCEMYKWMKREDVHISQISHTSTLLRRLEAMRYHSMLDTIEAGTARLKINEPVSEKLPNEPLTN